VSGTLAALFTLAACSATAGSDVSALQFKILSSDGAQTIGYTRFTVSRRDLVQEIKGETRYLDGQSDKEDVLMTVEAGTDDPRLESYQHSFFNADGTLHMLDALDAKSGVASCTTYTPGAGKMRKALLDVPKDSFAGASGLMMMAESLRHGIREIRFHAFACAPGPEMFAVKAELPDKAEHWPHYPGDLFRLDMKPDLGALNLVIAPFLPTMDAWFNPHDNWNYVGGEFDRYFRGPHVLTVRFPSD